MTSTPRLAGEPTPPRDEPDEPGDTAPADAALPEAGAPAGETVPPSKKPRPFGRLPLAALAAVVSGLAFLLAFPPYGQWWCAPVGVALLAAACHRRRFRAGLLLGFLSGLGLFIPLLSWTSIVVGQWPWPIVLAALEAAYVALLGGGSAAASRLADRWRPLWPVLVGTLWVAQEALRIREPFGGFPWGRLAFSQQDGPLAGLAAIGGAPLVTFGVGALGGALVALAWLPWRSLRTHRATGPAGRPLLTRVVAAVVVAAIVLLAGPVVPDAAPAGRTVRVAVIQGNVPRLGLEFNAQRRAVLDNHVNQTLALARAGGPKPDLVVWPENSSDIDPFQNEDAYQRIQTAADTIGAPILVGAVLDGPGRYVRNAGVVWRPGGGPQATIYVKRHPVPFAEYIPMRSLARKVTDKVDLVRSDFQAGHRIGAMKVGPATVGDVICFEVGYDGIVRDTVTHGANLLTVQTNNADFNTAEALQQLAIVRERAVEHGRPALMASTVGVSAFVDADGTVHDPTTFNTPAHLERRFRLGTGETLATRLGVLPEILLTVVALAALGGAAGLRWQQRRTDRTHRPGPAQAARG